MPENRVKTFGAPHNSHGTLPIPQPQRHCGLQWWRSPGDPKPPFGDLGAADSFKAELAAVQGSGFHKLTLWGLGCLV